MSRIEFVSDCHLTPARPEITDRFLLYLAEQVPGAKALYILGDLFDSWIGDDAIAPELEVVITALGKLRKQLPIYFIHGNRDFLIGRKFARRSGCKLLYQLSVVRLGGRRTLITHGDVFCTDDKAYQTYRLWVRNPVSKLIFKSLSLDRRKKISTYLRSRSEARKKRNSESHIMDVNQKTVEFYMQRFKVDQLIHGHTHRPAVHEFNMGRYKARRFVLGDWEQGGQVLSVTNGEAQLRKMSEPTAAGAESLSAGT